MPTAEDYDAFLSAEEAELMRLFPRWHWQLTRYAELPMEDKASGPPAWMRVVARLDDDPDFPQKTITIDHKAINRRTPTALASEIGERIEAEWSSVINQRALWREFDRHDEST